MYVCRKVVEIDFVFCCCFYLITIKYRFNNFRELQVYLFAHTHFNTSIWTYIRVFIH